MPSGIGSWRRPETSEDSSPEGRVKDKVAFSVAGRVDDFRLATVSGIC